MHTFFYELITWSIFTIGLKPIYAQTNFTCFINSNIIICVMLSCIYASALSCRHCIPAEASFVWYGKVGYIYFGSIGCHTSVGAQDLLTSGQINISRGYVFNGFNLAYGALAWPEIITTARAVTALQIIPPMILKTSFSGRLVPGHRLICS